MYRESSVLFPEVSESTAVAADINNLIYEIELANIALEKQDKKTRGRLFTNKEADELFGMPSVSLQMSNDKIKECLGKCDGFIMFNIFNDKVYVLDNNRNALIPAVERINKLTVFKTFDIEKVEALMKLGKEPVTYIEKRNDGIISLTNGLVTLEVGIPCPPYCN